MTETRLAILMVAGLAVLATSCTDDNAAGPSTSSSAVVEATTTTTIQEDPAFRVGLIGHITTDNWFASLESPITPGSHNLPQNRAYLGNSKAALYASSFPGFIQIPALAASASPPDAVQEGDIWVVEQPIRRDWIWSDGTPTTAADLAFYFEVVHEFKLGSEHAAAFGSAVVDVSEVDEYTVRIEFSRRPSLSDWSNGVGFAPFVPRHFWQRHVDSARIAGEAAKEAIAPGDAINAIVEESLSDDDVENDIAAEEVTQRQINLYISNAGKEAAASALYAVSGLGEPSIGPVIVEDWTKGDSAVTIANPSYFGTGNENTLYSDGSFRVANGVRDEDIIHGGEGAGRVLATYLEGPFFSEVRWIEHESKSEAYESLAAGRVDYVFDPGGIPAGLRDELSQFPGIEISENETDGLRYLGFNLRKPPMSDIAFRRAVATAVDKEFVNEVMLSDSVSPSYTIVPPGLIGHYNDEIDRPGWQQGVPMTQGERYDEAIAILRDAGYTWATEPVVVRDRAGRFLEVQPEGVGLTMPNGTLVPEIEILSPGQEYDPFRAAFATQIEVVMRNLGVPVTSEPTDFEEIVRAVFPPQDPESALQWEIYILAWGGSRVTLPGVAMRAFFHSDQEAVFFGGFNTTGYREAEFDALADEFDAATDLRDAGEITKRMDALIARDLPYLALFRVPVIEAYSRSLKLPVDSVMGGWSANLPSWLSAVQIDE